LKKKIGFQNNLLGEKSKDTVRGVIQSEHFKTC